MVLEEVVDKCLASQQIRELVKSGYITTSSDYENRIQPSSFEPLIGDKVYVLNTEEGLFRPDSDKTIYESLIRKPRGERLDYDITKGFTLNKGYTYLLPLQDKIKLLDDVHVKSSPKSSLGRLFLNTRLLSDYNKKFDEVSHINSDECLNLALLVQPLAFNVVVYPGLCLNQLRFIKGDNAKLSAGELKSEQVLYYKEGDEFVPTPQDITDGIDIHLDLEGKHTNGIVGLRVKNNPVAIDLKNKHYYSAEDYFTPLKVDSFNKNKVYIDKSEHCLLASKEVFQIPEYLNAELRQHENVGFKGPTHFAGFVDNGFVGDLVFEYRNEEVTKIRLCDCMTLSKIDLWKTDVPDKIYGKKIGSNYNFQIGCKPAKYFKMFDFKHAAKNYKKLDRLVLVQSREELLKYRKKEFDLEYMSLDEAAPLFDLINNGFFHSRYDCEDDKLVLQPICYVLWFDDYENVFSYVRADNIVDYGERKLFGKHSIGIGGHMSVEDGLDYIKNSHERENWEEIAKMKSYKNSTFIGTLMANDKPVDEVHFGLIFKNYLKSPIDKTEASIKSGRMLNIKDLMKDSDYKKKYETWSWRLIPHLLEIYNI